MCSYPWKLVALVDTRLDDSERLAICEKFKKARHCCLDEGFSSRLLQRVAPQQLLMGQQFHGVIVALSHQKVQNAEIEDNFARALSTSKCARGHIETHWRHSARFISRINMNDSDSQSMVNDS